MSEEYKSRTEKRSQQRKKTAHSRKVPKQKKTPTNKKQSIIKRILLALVLLVFLTLAGGAGLFAYFVKDAPELDDALLRDPISSKINDMNGDLITNIGSERRDYVQYKDIPVLMRDAILATEDARFFKHKGIDPIRLAGAVVKNVTEGFGSQGASTITQQVVKMSYLDYDKTLKRKAQEAWLAYKLEEAYSKEEIFEMYVNKVYMSKGINGIKAAADYFFGKELSELTLQEAAYIAGMPQSPNNYNANEHPENAEKRKDIVLSLMNQHDKITQSEMQDAQNQDITDSLIEPVNKSEVSKEYDSYVDLVVEEVDKMGYNAYSDGLIIETTLDKDAQLYMNKLLNSDEFINYPNELFQAGIALTDTQTGEIRAIGGGRNQEVQRGWNYAVDSQRQSGSVIKPLIDYGPAIEHLKWSTYEQIDDSPLNYSNGGPSVGNAGGSYAGMMTMREALVRSKNTPAVRTLKEVGFEDSFKFLSGLGIDMKNEYESYAIGANDGEDAISPLQLAGAYAAFGNGGTYNEPHTVTKITLPDGTEIKSEFKSESAMSDYTAYMISDMLKDVVDHGTGRAANIPGLPVAGKTGTTNYTADELAKYDIPYSGSPDAWFVGYTTNYTAAVWTGYENRTEYLSTESQQIAKELFKQLMTEISSDVETEDFEKPDSVVELAIVKGSNPAQIAGNGVSDSDKVYELFVRGAQPKRTVQKVKEKEPKKEPVEDDTEKPKQEEETTSGEVTGLSASADAGGNISVSWSFSGSGASFSVTNGAETQSIGGFSTVFGGGQPGQTYSITVTAIVDGQSVDSASTSVTIPGGQTVEPENPVIEPEEPTTVPETPEEPTTVPETPEEPTTVPETPEEPTTVPETPTDNGNGNGNNSGSTQSNSIREPAETE
ncbi:PBP1A family penicillin-binding protein [Domibacillus aminovorans]|uniref:Uncharacterized protein n=1 Tax=Domibacillus aminovorans TaxID=29332 RepID=A0A177KYP3_9BACI|nr:PBP1A family penicillin-binding protein [Domibacillus aminovorans]OAH58256.1 hypothetical protein AWH49_06090 [Domibacillus aminovorans]